MAKLARCMSLWDWYWEDMSVICLMGIIKCACECLNVVGLIMRGHEIENGKWEMGWVPQAHAGEGICHFAEGEVLVVLHACSHGWRPLIPRFSKIIISFNFNVSDQMNRWSLFSVPCSLASCWGYPW